MKTIFTIGLLLFGHIAFSQDSVSTRKEWDCSGYLKDLVWLRFDKDFQTAAATNLIHNRINLKWKPSEKIEGRLEVRNRFYWGDDVRRTPEFKTQLRNANEAFNLSAIWMENKSSILHSNIERLWLEYHNEKWNVRAGRQRINWGIANTWNPLDIFNSYSFLDFDYEERPGSDAVQLQYQSGASSNFELAIAQTHEHRITAIKYATNYKTYDLQAIAGVYQNIFTAGVGWAGSISDIGFKGEAAFYANQKDSASRLAVTIEGDYVFKNGWYLSSSFLYNERGLQGPLVSEANVVFQASPRNLMPAKWNWLIHFSKEYNPRLSGSFDIVYSPLVNMVILFPSMKYNILPNLDMDFFWQSIFASIAHFQAVWHIGFMRMKWSF